MNASAEAAVREPNRAAALAAVTGLLIVVVFQISLALGAPFGRAALGGTHEGRLPTDLRAVSVVSATIWALAALVIMRRSGLRDGATSPLVHRGAWVVVGVLAIGTVVNFASPSPWERFMWGPFSLILAGLCALIARSDPATP